MPSVQQSLLGFGKPWRHAVETLARFYDLAPVQREQTRHGFVQFSVVATAHLETGVHAMIFAESEDPEQTCLFATIDDADPLLLHAMFPPHIPHPTHGAPGARQVRTMYFSTAGRGRDSQLQPYLH